LGEGSSWQEAGGVALEEGAGAAAKESTVAMGFGVKSTATAATTAAVGVDRNQLVQGPKIHA